MLTGKCKKQFQQYLLEKYNACLVYAFGDSTTLESVFNWGKQ